MIDQNALDSASLADLVDLKERIEKTISDKMAAEKADLEKRQAALAKLSERIEKGVKGPKGPKPAKPTKQRAAANGAGKDADDNLRGDGAPAAAAESGGSEVAA